jgi:hypothetical protein
MVLASPLCGMQHSIMTLLPLFFSIRSIHSNYNLSFQNKTEDSLWFSVAFARIQIKILLGLNDEVIFKSAFVH